MKKLTLLNKIILSYSDDKLALIQKQSIKEKSITSKDRSKSCLDEI